MPTEAAVVVFDPADNVATAKTNLATGDDIGLNDVEGRLVVLKDPIPFGHKVAIRAIPEGAWVVKYGAPIGRATRAIAVGEHVHIHNLVSARGKVRP
jgi:altronate dehydratase small subunit